MPWPRFRVSDELRDDVSGLIGRAMSWFPVRCLLRFITLEGFDRAIVLSSQVFTAVIPLFILVATFTPADAENVVSRAIIERFALKGDSAAAVHQLFDAPPGAASGVTFFSALLLVYSGVAFTRRTQRMYRAAWHKPERGRHSALSAPLGLVAILLGIAVASGVRSLADLLGLHWLGLSVLSTLSGVLLWTAVPYLLLDREIHWRRLLVTGVLTAVAMTGLAVATPIYMPALVVQYADQFGLFGITITFVGWLLTAACIIVVAATVAAEFDATTSPWALRVKISCKLLDPGEPTPVVQADPDYQGLRENELRALLRVLVNWTVMAGVAWATTSAMPGIDVHGTFAAHTALYLVLGLLNTLLGPVLFLVGGFRPWVGVSGWALVVNVAVLALAALLSDQVVAIDDVTNALLAAALITVSGTLLTLLAPPVPGLDALYGVHQVDDRAQKSPGRRARLRRPHWRHPHWRRDRR